MNNFRNVFKQTLGGRRNFGFLSIKMIPVSGLTYKQLKLEDTLMKNVIRVVVAAPLKLCVTLKVLPRSN